MRVKEGNKESDILNAAVKVFADTGFHNSKMSKIAEVANVSIGSLYVYYKNKEEILLNIFDVVWKKLYKGLYIIVERNDLNPVEKYDSMIDMVFDAFSESPAIAIVIANEQYHIETSNPENFTEYFYKFIKLGDGIIEDGMKTKVFNPNVDAKIYRVFFMGGFRDLMTNWAVNNKEFKLNQIRQNIKFLVKNGILNHINK